MSFFVRKQISKERFSIVYNGAIKNIALKGECVMMKKMVKMTSLLLGVMTAAALEAGTAFAWTPSSGTPRTAEGAAEALAANSSLFYVSGSQLKAHGTDDDTFWDEMNNAVNAVFRACDPSEMDSLTASYDTAAPDILSYRVSEDQLQILADNQALVDDWLAANVPVLIPDGTNKEDAIWLAYIHVVNAYAPDYAAEADTGYKRKEAQGAAYALKNGSGICAGLSKLFRSIVEYLPFDPQTGQVNYSAANPSRIRVAILMNEAASHEWAAIQLGDSWYYYDLAIINTANLAERYRMNGSQLNPADYGNFAETVWRY